MQINKEWTIKISYKFWLINLKYKNKILKIKFSELTRVKLTFKLNAF